MGQAKLKAGTARLHFLEIRGQLVSYDTAGRAKGSAPLPEPIYLIEADIPQAVVDLVRQRFPKLEFVTIEPESQEVFDAT